MRKTPAWCKLGIMLTGSSLLERPLVTVHAGTKEYHRPKALICRIVPFFASAFNDGYAELRDNVIDLDLGENSIDVFNLFLI